MRAVGAIDGSSHFADLLHVAERCHDMTGQHVTLLHGCQDGWQAGCVAESHQHVLKDHCLLCQWIHLQFITVLTRLKIRMWIYTIFRRLKMLVPTISMILLGVDNPHCSPCVG